MRLLSCLALAAFLLNSAHAEPSVILTVTNRPGYAIPADYCGLSFGAIAELPNHGGVSGYFFSPTNTQLITLFRNSGLHHLRLGGSTVDWTNVPFPDQEAIDNVFGFARAAGVRVMYSLRLKNGDIQTDTATARYIWAHYRDSLDCFAIGNEPDVKGYHYPPFGSGTDPAITNYSSYLTVWSHFASALTNAIPGVLLAGPDAAGKVWAPLFARDEKSSGIVSMITQHFYVGGRPYVKGGTDTIPVREAIDTILSENWVARRYPPFYTSAVAPVVAEGLPYRMTESNDYLKGIAGASDAFASALWALDYLHWWAARGCTGVDFHNTEWLKTDTVFLDSSGAVRANPKALGIRAFDLGGHGRVEPIAVSNPGKLNLTAYAVADRTNLWVTVINKEHGETARDSTVTITLEGFEGGPAATMALAASHGDAGAMTGNTLGDEVMDNRTSWQGTWTPLKPGQPGQYQLKVAATSATVVKISAR
jgi:hypothetical protein